MIPTLANIRKAIYCLNKRLDLLEGGEYSSTVTQLSNKVAALESLLDDDAQNPTAVIDKFNEIVAFLNSINNTDTLSGLLQDIISQIPDAQIQSDWNQTDNTKKDYIKNKPTIPDAQIQSDWNQTNNNSKDYIKNKPTIPTVPSNETATLGGTTLSVVTTGEKYNWNNKANIWKGTQDEYELISIPDDNTVYVIIPAPL